MRAQTVHITDHALLRWKERATETGEANVHEIVTAVKRSKVIKKCEPLPYPLPRLDGSVYSFGEGILFVMEPVTIDEYRLVTVIGEASNNYYCRPPRPKPRQRVEKTKEKMEIFDIPDFSNVCEERSWLITEKRRLEKELAHTPKRTQKHKEILIAWGVIEDRLLKNKPKYAKERDAQHENNSDNDRVLLKTILSEVRALRSLIEANPHVFRPGSQGNRATNGFVHVQPAIARVSDLAAQGSDDLQLAAQPDSDSERAEWVSGSTHPDAVEATAISA